MLTTKPHSLKRESKEALQVELHILTKDVLKIGQCVKDWKYEPYSITPGTKHSLQGIVLSTLHFPLSIFKYFHTLFLGAQYSSSDFPHHRAKFN